MWFIEKDNPKYNFPHIYIHIFATQSNEIKRKNFY